MDLEAKKMLSDHDLQRLAAMAHVLRPDWPSTSVQTYLRRHLAERPFRDLAIALAYVSCEPATATPARLLAAAGPWWRAAAVANEQPAPQAAHVDRLSRCTTCGKSRADCERNPHSDHDYESEADYRTRTGQQPLSAGKTQIVANVERHMAEAQAAEEAGRTGEAAYHDARAQLAKSQTDWQAIGWVPEPPAGAAPAAPTEEPETFEAGPWRTVVYDDDWAEEPTPDDWPEDPEQHPDPSPAPVPADRQADEEEP